MRGAAGEVRRGRGTFISHARPQMGAADRLRAFRLAEVKDEIAMSIHIRRKNLKTIQQRQCVTGLRAPPTYFASVSGLIPISSCAQVI